MSAKSYPENWYDQSWQHRLEITINHKMVSGAEELLNFPLYFTDQREEFRKAQPTGADFLFTAADGITKLSHEIRFWDPLECRLAAYVKIPRLSPVEDTKLFLYYENSSVQDQQDVAGTWDDHYVYVRHFGDAPRGSPCGARGGTITPTDYFEMQVRVLEDLFGREWFNQPSPRRDIHPAYQSWKFCKDAIATGGQVYARDRQELQNLALKWAQAFGDNWSLVQSTKGNVADFHLGQLSNYGDDKVISRLKGVLPEHRQYRDVMAELLCVGWHSLRGHHVRVSETPGWADFKISIPDWHLPVIADCKRLSEKATEKTLKRRIEKANKQIKAVGEDSYGLVILNVTDLVPNTRPLSDDCPREVSELAGAVQRLLSKGVYTAVSGALLYWDEVSVMGPEPGGRGFLMVLRTKSIITNHTRPIHPLPVDTTPLRIAYTLESFVRFSGRQWE